ncbi:Hypothetical predicted protein [Mytilus galloprovincialis]|uniref:SWIM-type domain-containing protein n=1 Tax=Mytilus galloprovincialis TaxID=29158 RepID=A0A8B6DHB3_MYTGA|nr:Hypothetical predicted protein [Mytilus galloprovincialis]
MVEVIANDSGMDEDSYSEFYRELKDTNLESVIRYFDKNWHPIRTEWVEGLKDNTTNLMNNTNNRVESTNQKLKRVISKFSNIVAFFDDLMKTVKYLRTERDHRAITIFQKVKVNRFESNSSLSEYLKQVTPFGYIAKQMEASHKITYDGAITSNTVAVSLPSSDGDLTVTATTCDCGFFKSMTLPCRHILFFRRQSQTSAHTAGQKLTIEKSHVVFDESQQPENNIQLTTTPRRRRVCVLSGQDKYRRVHGTTQQLARLVSDMPMRQFNEHVQKLEQIVDLLKDGKEYNVQDVHQDDILADTITTSLNPIVEICQDNEDGDDNRGSLQMDDVASSTSQSLHDNAEPHITALELATRIQDQFNGASSSSTATNGNTSQDDESHHDSTHDNGVTSSGM